MRLYAWKFLRCSLIFFLLAGKAMAAADRGEILVAAAASLTDALGEIAKLYQSRTHHKAGFTFASSSALARQIEEGAPADIFFSADVAQMDRLEKNALLEPGTRKNVLSNQLVIVVPADSTLAVASPGDLLKPAVKRIALAEPSSVPAGVYAKKYLQDRNLWDKIQQKVIPVLDVRATLASVESGNVEAGFVYRTDAASSNRVKIVFPVPANEGPRITYPVAIIKDSKNKQAARDFIGVMLTPAGKDVFRKHGFIVLN